MSAKFKQVIYAGQKLVDESGGGGGNYQEKSVSFTPTESQQTEQVKPDSGYDALSKVNVTVGAISPTYVGSEVPTQAAQTIHPSTTDQTITSGKYLTGAQTIKAVTTTNLTAANIVSGVTVEIGDSDDSDCVASVTGTASGGGEVAPNDVNFYDYDGTLLYSYSAADFANLSALPANPTHTGLTAQGWNWTLFDAKTYVASYGMLDIGQMYITDDGNTRIYISILDISKQFTIRCYKDANGTATINWGDGNTESITRVTNGNITHSYATPGDYKIVISVTEGKIYFAGSSSSNMFGSTSYVENETRAYKIELGSNIGSFIQACYKCYGLQTINIPKYLTSFGTNSFNGCNKLKAVVIPDDCTVISASMFSSCYSLKKVLIPKTITSIDKSAFSNSQIPKRIIIPQGVTSIGNSALNTNSPSGPTVIIVTPTDPPELGTSFIATSSMTEFYIYVPNGSLTDYQSETNWSDYASYMVEMHA